MSPRNLFNVVLKIMGILFLKYTIELAPQFLQLVPYIKDTPTFDMICIASSLIAVLVIYLAFTYMLIFKSDYLITKLKLTSGFDEIIPINADRKTIIGISVIIIGGLVVIDSVPLLFKQVYNYYLSMQISQGMAKTKYDVQYFILYTSKIIIGLLLMGEQKRITNLIYRYTDNDKNK